MVIQGSYTSPDLPGRVYFVILTLYPFIQLILYLVNFWLCFPSRSRFCFVAFDWSLCSALAMSHIPSTPAAHTPSVLKTIAVEGGHWIIRVLCPLTRVECRIDLGWPLTLICSYSNSLCYSRPIENCAVDSWKTCNVYLHSHVSALLFFNNIMNQIDSGYICMCWFTDYRFEQLFLFM